MYQNEMKERFIEDYSRSRIISKSDLYELFGKMEFYENEANIDCSLFEKERVLQVLVNFKSRSVHELSNNMVVLKSYCRYMQYYHRAQTTSAYEEITLDDLKCIRHKQRRLAHNSEK